MTDLSNTPLILLIGMGGTIAGLQVNGDGKGYLAGQVPIETLSGQIKSKLSIKNKQLSNIDSCDMTESLLTQLGQEVVQALHDPHIVGVVVTHGTDTMTLTASYLAKHCNNKTIVLTGAMIPYKFGSSDGLFNLGSALAFVQVLPTGVYIAMNGKIFEANKVQKNKERGEFEAL